MKVLSYDSSVIVLKVAKILKCLHLKLWLPAPAPGYKRNKE